MRGLILSLLLISCDVFGATAGLQELDRLKAVTSLDVEDRLTKKEIEFLGSLEDLYRYDGNAWARFRFLGNSAPLDFTLTVNDPDLLKRLQLSNQRTGADRFLVKARVFKVSPLGPDDRLIVTGRLLSFTLDERKATVPQKGDAGFTLE